MGNHSSRHCLAADPLTPGGTVTQTQFTTASFDYNLACPSHTALQPDARTGTGQGEGPGTAGRDERNSLDLGGLLTFPDAPVGTRPVGSVRIAARWWAGLLVQDAGKVPGH